MNSNLEHIIAQELGSDKYSGSVKTTTVSLHVSQMLEWGVRGGHIQFKAIQDDNNIRKDFILKLIEKNRIKPRLDYIMKSLVCRGEILWLITIGADNEYKINYYTGGKNNPNPEYEVFYSSEFGKQDEIECVLVIDEVTDNNMYGGMPLQLYGANFNDNQRKIYYLSFIDKQRTITFRFDIKPANIRSFYYMYKNNLDSISYSTFVHKPIIKENIFINEFPFVICKNIEHEPNQSGVDDFSVHKGLIEEHNELLSTASENLYIYNTPTLVTSRDASAVVEGANEAQEMINNTWAGQNGYKSPLQSKSNPGFRMPRVFGNVRDNERFAYVQSPDAVSGDQNLFIRQLRELIHWILGGVDPLGISSSATFGEIKSLFGRIENTASKKAECLLSNLCKLLSRIIQREENIAKLSITRTLIASQSTIYSESQIASVLTDKDFRDLYFYYKEININIPGLPPLGNPKCSWKFTRSVFQNTTRERLDESIIYRNEREDGISQEVALSRLYPDMSDDEIRQMMSGFSPRVVQTDLAGIQGLLQLYTALMQVPDPETNIPWALKLGLNQLVEQSVMTLQKELQYNIPNFKEDNSINNDQINQLLSRLLNASIPANVPTGADTNPAERSRASRTTN
jgi:hypothetical protein